MYIYIFIQEQTPDTLYIHTGNHACAARREKTPMKPSFEYIFINIYQLINA